MRGKTVMEDFVYQSQRQFPFHDLQCKRCMNWAAASPAVSFHSRMVVVTKAMRVNSVIFAVEKMR